MLYRVLAALAAGLLVIGLSLAAAGALRSERPVEVTSQNAAVRHDTPDAIEALLEFVEALIQELRAAYNEHLEDAAPAGSLTPLQDDEPDDPTEPNVASSDEDKPGCEVDHDSGPGWSRTEVRCHHEEVTRNGGSISISSSSSSTTTSSSSSD